VPAHTSLAPRAARRKSAVDAPDRDPDRLAPRGLLRDGLNDGSRRHADLSPRRRETEADQRELLLERGNMDTLTGPRS
jgi:hypothetical protein